jgi:uncharacterized protein (TIGR03435 family)
VPGARFDIEATMPPGTTPAQRPEMLRGLLEDRFSVKAMREVRSMPVFALMRLHDDGRLGPQLTQVERDCRPRSAEERELLTREERSLCSTAEGRGRWTLRGAQWEHIRLPLLAGAYVGTPVVDRTGLSGQFDLTLEWQDDPVAGPDQIERLPPFVAALREQLGLARKTVLLDQAVTVRRERSAEAGGTVDAVERRDRVHLQAERVPDDERGSRAACSTLPAGHTRRGVLERSFWPVCSRGS